MVSASGKLVEIKHSHDHTANKESGKQISERLHKLSIELKTD